MLSIGIRYLIITGTKTIRFDWNARIGLITYLRYVSRIRIAIGLLQLCRSLWSLFLLVGTTSVEYGYLVDEPVMRCNIKKICLLEGCMCGDLFDWTVGNIHKERPQNCRELPRPFLHLEFISST